MLINPFTPSDIASSPDDFFGRGKEMQEVRRALEKGSVAIHGAIGIGKSSLLARSLLDMEGLGSEQRADSIAIVGHKDITNLDEAARVLLEELVSIDEKKKTVKFKIGSLFEHESGEVSKNFSEGRHLAALQKLLARETLKSAFAEGGLLILAVDEADKCPVPVAQLIRAVTTQTQLKGIKNIRFLTAGVSPYFDQMLKEDPGIARFVYKTISLEPMSAEEATDLLQTKLDKVMEESFKSGLTVEVAPDVIPRIVALSGGHPHILQLLGSYLIEHENEDPDGIIDEKDLYNTLMRICYQDRAQTYDGTVHMLKLTGKLDDFRLLMSLAPQHLPTRIGFATAIDAVGPDAIKWFVDHDILAIVGSAHYGLVDEFLRIRLMLDAEQTQEQKLLLQARIVEEVSTEEFAEAELGVDDALSAGERPMPAYGDDEEESDSDVSDREDDY